MRVKITRVEIWEVDNSSSAHPTDVVNLDDFVDSIRDDILNSQDTQDETDDGQYQIVPKEIVEDIRVEEADPHPKQRSFGWVFN